jgi:hypothetical protein
VPVRYIAESSPSVLLRYISCAIGFVQVIDTSDLRVFLMQPGPRTGPVLCHIRRSKGSSLYPKCALTLTLP